MKLYHYTSVGKFKKIWINEKNIRLKFSESNKTNDVFEKYKFLLLDDVSVDETYIPDVNYSSLKRKFSDILNEYKQISFCANYIKENIRGNASPMMWGQYAFRSKGVCIELDLEKLKLDKEIVWHQDVHYTPSIPLIECRECELSCDNDIRQFIKKNQKDIFFEKHKHWEHENEYRMISNCLDYLQIEDAISAVYVPDSKGYAFREVKKKLKNSRVKLCYMHPTSPVGYGTKIQFLVYK